MLFLPGMVITLRLPTCGCSTLMLSLALVAHSLICLQLGVAS